MQSSLRTTSRKTLVLVFFSNFCAQNFLAVGGKMCPFIEHWKINSTCRRKQLEWANVGGVCATTTTSGNGKVKPTELRDVFPKFDWFVNAHPHTRQKAEKCKFCCKSLWQSMTDVVQSHEPILGQPEICLGQVLLHHLVLSLRLEIPGATLRPFGGCWHRCLSLILLVFAVTRSLQDELNAIAICHNNWNREGWEKKKDNFL